MISGVFITVTVCVCASCFLFFKRYFLCWLYIHVLFICPWVERHAQLSKFERNFGLLESFEVSLCMPTACQKLVFILNYNWTFITYLHVHLYEFEIMG